MKSEAARGGFIKPVMEETTPALPKAGVPGVPFHFSLHFNNDLNFYTGHGGAPPLLHANCF